ncbi:unnamed protein product [Diamesa serratosioi]
MIASIFSKIGLVAQVACVSHCMFEYVADFVVCSGESMQPTLFSNNILICDRFSPRMNRLFRNDIVISKHPNQPLQYICKRIVATPGDIVIVDETEDKTGKEGTKNKLIPVGHVFLEGDNSQNSTDSRNYGPIPKGLIRSKVIARIWPLSEFKVF